MSATTPDDQGSGFRDGSVAKIDLVTRESDKIEDAKMLL